MFKADRRLPIRATSPVGPVSLPVVGTFVAIPEPPGQYRGVRSLKLR